MMTLGDLISVKSPSGETVTLTPEEEREIVKEVLEEKIKNNMLIGSDIRRSAISAIGNAIGFAVGGFLIGYFIKKK